MNGDGRGLSWIEETAQGFLGKPVKFSETSEGFTKATFDLGCGADKADMLQFTIWRQCIAYRDLAEKLKVVRMGCLIKVEGFLTRIAKRDNKRQVMRENGSIVTVDRLICNRSLEIIPKEKYRKENPQLPLQVGTADSEAVGV